MQIVRDLAGYSWGRSDLVRRAMSKKKHKVMEEERKNFVYGILNEDGTVQVPGCVRNGVSEENANKIFDQMIDFASYAFNKSHAAAYAVVGYQTAYLMCYYPAEFIAAMLNSIMGNNEKVAYYIRFAEDIGIKVLPPDINESYTKFTVKGNTIRFGMSAVKNVGMNVIDSIVARRAERGSFKSFGDFCNKIDTSAVNKKAVESLIKVGAYDSLGVSRSKLMAVFERLLDGINNERKRNVPGQMSLFNTGEDNSDDALQISYPNIKEFNKKYMLAMEKEMTGIYLSGNPLDDYERTLRHATTHKISDLVTQDVLEEGTPDMASASGGITQVKDRQKVILGGLLTSVSRKITRNNQAMAFATLEDLYGTIEVVIFPKTYNSYREFVEEDEIVIIEGRVAIEEDEKPKILCEKISPINAIQKEKIYIRVEGSEHLDAALEKLKKVSMEYKGETPVYLCTTVPKKAYLLNKNVWLMSGYEVMEELNKVFGEDNVKKVEV